MSRTPLADNAAPIGDSSNPSGQNYRALRDYGATNRNQQVAALSRRRWPLQITTLVINGNPLAAAFQRSTLPASRPPSLCR